MALLITWMGPALTGGLGGSSRAARVTTRAQVRPRPCPLTRAGLSSMSPRVHATHADTCLRSRYTGEAALIDTTATAVIARVGSAVTDAATPPPIASPLPLQRVLSAPGLCAARDPAATRDGKCARMMGVLLSGAL